MIIGKILDNWGAIKHYTYKIQKGDTPISVADKLEITLYELRAYHNFNCLENADVINADFPGHLQYLLLKPTKLESDHEQEEIKPTKVIFDNDFRIPFHNVRGKNSYMVFQTIENNEQSQSIKYKVSVECITKDKNGYSLFGIDRVSKVYVNNFQTDTITDTIAEEVSSILYPLLIVVDQEGKWIDIHNFSDIVERWIIKRRDILEANEGQAINKYLDAVNSVLDKPENLLINLSDDWFLKVFFNGIHTTYTPDLSFPTKADFAITPKETPIIFEVTQKISEYLNDANMIVIEKKGLLTDSSKEIVPENNNFSGSYHAIYHLNPNTYAIENVSLECDFTRDSSKKATVKMYNLNDRKVIASGQKQSFFVGETIKKESFFKDLFKLH